MDERWKFKKIEWMEGENLKSNSNEITNRIANEILFFNLKR